MSEKIIIIGAGTYGSYLANALIEKYPETQIHLFDVGNKKIQSERQIGFLSKLKGSLYNAASAGRFFGLGGTSSRWGGQLLFFSDNDFSNPGCMKEIVDAITYKTKVLNRFFQNFPLLIEKPVTSSLFVKQGIWLKMKQRNMFKHFRLATRHNVTVHENARIVRLNTDGNQISSISVQYPDKSNPVEIKADRYYLTSGAFESLRLLDVSGIKNMRSNSQGFSDHVSLRCFRIMDKRTEILSHNFQFKFSNGSLITSRLVGEIDNVSFYVHPIFNENFKIFQFLKKFLFKGQISLKELPGALLQFFAIFPFIYRYLVKKELYIYGNWYLNIDVELAQSDNYIALSDEIDQFGQKGLDINYKVSQKTLETIATIKAKIKQLLIDENINFDELNEKAVTSNLEDVYHPFGLFSNEDKLLEKYNPKTDLFMFNTGLLSRGRRNNPTASLFCLIEHHVDCLS